MVKKTLIAALILALLMPSMVWAAEFTASVNRNQVAVGESFTLKLELSGASAKSKPAVSGLKKYFDVTSRGQSSNTVIINGDVSSSTSWTYTLTPKKEGEMTILPVSIETSDGKVSSQTITVSVGKASSLPSVNQRQGVAITAKVSKRNPYKSEPITYTATLVSRHDLANIKLSEISVDNAIVEAIGKPAIYDKVQNGIAVKVIEAKYRITPLREGRITIPSMIIQGGIPVRGSRFGSLLDDELDPFGMFRDFDRFGAFGVTKLEPFSVASDEITLEVKPPVAGVNPWLPATSIEISENFDDSQTLKVGEPITRSFMVVAEGVASRQLPSLEVQQNKADGFRVYADNPITEDDVKGGIVASWRQENYTLIPQKAGTLTLPEVSIAWWDVNKSKIAYATVPARTLEIAPGVQSSYTPPATQQAVTSQAPEPVQQQAASAPETTIQTLPVGQQDNRLLYALIAGLVVMLLFVFFWVISLQRKVARLAETKESTAENIKPREDTKQAPIISNKELGKVTTAKELQHFLQRYGQKHWKTSKNVSLETLLSAAKQQCPKANKEADLILKALQDALYADKEFDIDEVKKHCTTLLATAVNSKKNAQKDTIDKLPDLNPS